MRILTFFKTKYFSAVLILAFFLSACLGRTDENIGKTGLEMSVKMADSEMVHFPHPSTVDFNPNGKWNYTVGLIAESMIKLWKETGDDTYYKYAKGYADDFINEDGDIRNYKLTDFNIDKLNSGRFLFDLYEETGDERYKKAIYLLRDQLRDHPRVSEGGFWHKKRYTHQMWLDGLYMGAPFYARFAKEFNEPEAFDDVVNQFVVVHKHTYDSEAKLNYHGWDESRQQRWADPETGLSPNFWGRAMGWYSMAIVDVLDYLPENHEGREAMLNILDDVVAGIKKHQDSETGLWYQVLDQGNREGNYLESSVSSMFVYALAKALRKGYISESYLKVTQKGYKGILDNFIKENENGTINITTVCAVAGLGGNPYRDGTFDYYISEPVRENDPKGVGPFIQAGIELYNINPN
jgi:unsaturated rhamnogalacturonyl hydrolase